MEEETRGRSIEEERGGVRIHVGGLGESVSRDDLLKIFSPMGSVESVDFVRTKGRSFAYIDFSPSSQNSLTKLFSTYNGCVWKGGKLRLEKAKEHYLAKLKREWEDCSDDNTISLPQPPSASDTAHLQIFFPRLRKVKSLPLSGTGKHKYSFQRVEVPSLPKYFCDCEEHSTSHIPQGNCLHDLETHCMGINEEELNIMNSVMNKLFQANSEPAAEGFLVNEKENDIEEEDQDNLVINVVSSSKTMLPLSRNWEQETVSGKRKSTHNGTQETREGPQGQKRNCVHPSKVKQSIINEGSGRKKSTLEIPEKNEPSEVDPDITLAGSSRAVSGVNHSSSSVSWSQKSSWKALVASANNSKFSVSSVLSGIASGKEEQRASHNSDFVHLPTEEDLNLKEGAVPSMEASAPKSTVKGQKSKSKTPRKTGKLVAGDTTQGNESTPTERSVKDVEEAIEHTIKKQKSPRKTGKLVAADSTQRNKSTHTDPNVETEPAELESSVRYSAIETSFQISPSKEIIVGAGSSPVASSLLTSTKDDHFEPEKSDAEKDVNKETLNLTVNKVVDNDLDEGKGPLEALNRSGRGSSWLQKSSWTQLVSEKNTSFSITQLFPGLDSENHEPREVNHEDAEISDPNQREGSAEQMECKPSEDAFRAVGVTEDSVTWNSSDGSQPNHGGDALTPVAAAEYGLTERKTIGPRIDIGETCTFMRSSASLKAWSSAKRAVSEPRKRKSHKN